MDGDFVEYICRSFPSLVERLKAGIFDGRQIPFVIESQNFFQFCDSMHKMELAPSCMIAICRAF